MVPLAGDRAVLQVEKVVVPLREALRHELFGRAEGFDQPNGLEADGDRLRAEEVVQVINHRLLCLWQDLVNCKERTAAG